MKKFLVLLLSLILIISLAACGNNEDKSSTTEETSSVSTEEVTEDNYPNKPIEVIVAYKAGGGTDVGARILASEAEKVLGQPVVIINREGADGEIGYTELAQATPDGYKIGFINLPTFVSLNLERNTKYELDDVVPILNHVFDSGVIVVQASSDFQTIDDLINFAKENPSTVTISNNGAGASNHIGAAHFAHEAGIEVTHVPFGGSTDMLAALRGGHVMATVAKISEVAALADSGELRILASFTEDRLEDFPEVPTLKEKGYDILFGSARALVAPKGTPEDKIQILHDAFKEALESDEHMEKAKKADLPIMYMGPEELGQYIKDQETYLKEISNTIDL